MKILIASLSVSLCLVLIDAFTPSIGHQRSPSSFVSCTRPQLCQQQITTRLLLAKKKAAVAPTKLQVKLLRQVPGTGQKGDVVQVTPAFYQNKLQPTRAAQLISDEQVAAERAIQQAQAEATNAQAKLLQDILQADGFQLLMTRKSGPDGQLFGGIGPKAVVTELQSLVKDECVKNIKVKVMMDAGKIPIKGDVKHTGKYYAELELTKEIFAKIPVIVQAE